MKRIKDVPFFPFFLKRIKDVPFFAGERIDFLRDEIRRHNRLYYTENSPEISDGEYDDLYAELKKLEEENPSLVSADSPTQKVGGSALPSFKSVTHKTPMLSLENTYSGEDI
ncbi:MAG: DNA ligase (NAD(+)) LigA, partial [Elusimicrobia bacterium CG_4_8_14_3_um_filter_50_9]